MYQFSPTLSIIKKTNEEIFGKSYSILLHNLFLFFVIFHHVHAFKEQMPVQKTKPNRSTCMLMEVEEHVSCKCGCLIKPKDCQKHEVKISIIGLFYNWHWINYIRTLDLLQNQLSLWVPEQERGPCVRAKRL